MALQSGSRGPVTQEQQTCRAMVPSARQEMKRPGAFTAKPCGLPIEGYGECAEIASPLSWTTNGEGPCVSPPEDHPLYTGHPYQPSRWRHVWDLHNANVADEIDASHPATPVGETR